MESYERRFFYCILPSSMGTTSSISGISRVKFTYFLTKISMERVGEGDSTINLDVFNRQREFQCLFICSFSHLQPGISKKPK
jgi:hypothetical protein